MFEGWTWIEWALSGTAIFLGICFLEWTINIVRPTQRGVIERFGRYNRFAEPGLILTIPFLEKLHKVNITEQIVEIAQQEIITNDNLNATVDAQIYYKVRPDEKSIKAALYGVNEYDYQIVQLARTTMRNIIGTLSLKTANSERGKINKALQTSLRDETKNWGIEIVRAELKELMPPSDVQVVMNKVVKAENEKIAAVDTATATETEADGQRRAAIKRAEGEKRALVLTAEGEMQAAILEAEGRKKAIVLEAEGQASAIQAVNEAADKFFVGNAKEYRKLEVAENTISGNSKIIVPAGSSLVNVISEAAGVPIIPLDIKPKEKG